MISTHSYNANIDDFDPRIAVDCRGNSYVTWMSGLGVTSGVYWVKIDASGTPGTVQLISNHQDNANYSESNPHIGIDVLGNSYVAYRGYDGNDYEIYWVKIDASGAVGNAKKISTHTDNITNDERTPRIAVDLLGNSYVTWRGDDGNDWEIYWVRVDSSGTAGTVQKISTHSENINGNDFKPVIGVDASGNSYVAWRGRGSGNQNIYWVKIDASGTPGTVQKISTHTDNVNYDDWDPEIVVDYSGNSCVTWRGHDGNDEEIYWVRVDASGIPGTVQKISTHTDNVSNDDYYAKIAADYCGNSYVTWQGWDGNDWEIYWVKVDSSGTVGTVQKKNITGEFLLNAVKECWASLWAEPAVEYRKRIGITENLKMAVLVQEMVPAKASGVLFTEDPMVIEGVWGLGDILVGGKVIPDQFQVEKRGLQIKKRNISHKTIMSTVNPEGGTHILDVPDHLRDTPVLDDNDIQALCTIGKKVEVLFECSQDIEWALQDNNLILLQARPITVKQEYEPDVWSRANAADTVPGYVTYLSRIPENKPDDIVLGLTPLLECFGIKEDPETLKFREYIYGYIYLNMTTIGNALGQIPGLSKDVLYQSLGHTTGEEAPKPTLKLSTVLKLHPGTIKVMQFFLQLPKRAHKVIPYSQELITDIRHKNLQELSEKQLEDLVWDMYERNSQVFQVHSVTALAAFALFGMVQKITARIGEDGTENVLTIGLEGMSSSQLGVEMWKLAEYASRSEKVSKIIVSGRKTVPEELERFPEGLNFLEVLRKFLGQYGDRCSQELELSIPRWEEDPLFVLSMVRTYLNSPVNPVNTMEEQKRTRLEATDRILKNMSANPLKLVFKVLLKKTQQYIVVRENLKTTWVRGISAMRVLYLTIAEKLINKKILERKEDIFYLKMTEVSQIIEGTLQRGDIMDVIEERKKEKRECEHIEVPEVVVGSPPPIEELQCTVELKDILEGTGCSQGVVTGRARVIEDPRIGSDFEQGDILVAPHRRSGVEPPVCDCWRVSHGIGRDLISRGDHCSGVWYTCCGGSQECHKTY